MSAGSVRTALDFVGASLLATRRRRSRASSLPPFPKVAALIVCLLGLISLHAAPAPTSGGLQQSFTGDNVKATLFIPSDTLPRFGFVPVRIAIDNQQSRELRWPVAFEVNLSSNYGAGSITHSATVLQVPATRNTERWLFVPTAEPGVTRTPTGLFVTGWANCAVTLQGTAIGETRLNFNAGGRTGNPMMPWAVSASLEAVVRSRLVALKSDPPPGGGPPVRAIPRGRPAPLPSGPQPLLRGPPNFFSFDPAQALGDWRVWSPFSRVILRADEYAAMPPANRAALRSWVALGGALYLVPETVGAARREPFGAGQVITLAQAIAAQDTDHADGLFTAAGVFTPSLAIANELSLQRGGLADRIPPAKRVGDWLVYFFVGFAVLIAPVNLFAIAPVRRRHWLFLTVPVISLAAVGILVVAIYLQDGIGGDGARRSLVVLLPGDNQAAVFQEQVSRTGLLVGASFPLADDTLCAAAPADDANFQPGRAFEYNRQDGRASGDWFRGRARQAQHLRRLTPTRARVERVGTAPDGAPIVQSSVGTVLRDFRYVDLQQRGWSIAQLPPGTRVTLQRQPGDAGLVDSVRKFREPGSVLFQDLVWAGTRPAERGRFVALADDSELAPLPTLDSIRWRDSAVLFTGIVEEPVAVGKAAP